MAISSIDGTNFITGAYSAGKGGNISELKSVIQGGGSPIANFAMVAAYFAGQEEKTMQKNWPNIRTNMSPTKNV